MSHALIPVLFRLRPFAARVRPGSVALLILAAAAQGLGQTEMPMPRMEEYNRRMERVPIFFPPNPPPLGRALARGPAPTGRYAAPAELANYVNEPFYPALATRLYTKSLGPKLRAELDRYRAAKVALQNELRTELDRLRPMEPAARIEQLAAISRRQTPKITELEKSAEQLRRELITGDYSWTAAREWHLGDNPKRGFSPIEISQVMRGYAFYQNGLLPGQRRLLLEISLELQMAADSAQKATAAQPHMFFPPEPARVLIPDDAPAAVAAKVADYQTKKSQLKKDLYDAVYRHDGEHFSLFTGTLRKLADRQAPKLAELDRLAEEIRVGLASLPEPDQVTERSPLPPMLHARVASLSADLQSAQKEATEKLDSILANTPEVRGSYRFETEGLKFVIFPVRGMGRGGPAGSTKQEPQKVQDARAAFAAIAEDYGRRLAELINVKDALVVEAASVLGTTKPDAINHALAAALRVANAKETESIYRDYRIAVFQPGLSPEQRRLLFDWVVEQLGLPLPRGELQPMQRGNSW
jgi:hypothetical protein